VPRRSRGQRAARAAIHSAPAELDPHLQNESLTSAVLAKPTPVYVVPAGSPARITERIGTAPYRLARADGRRLDLVPAATAGDRIHCR